MIELSMDYDYGFRCDQCGREQPALVMVGAEADRINETQPALLCRDCVLLALMAFEEAA